MANNLITDKELAEFLTTKPLYYKYKVVEKYEGEIGTFTNPLDFVNKSFKFKCPKEDEVQTFKLKEYGNTYYGRYDDLNLSRLPLFFDKDNGMLDMTFPLLGSCQSCSTEISFLIRITSSRSWYDKELGIDIYIQKVGQFPGYDITLDSDLERYLTSEDKANYRKALINLSSSYGIGAFAYLRRVLENELVRIVKDVSQLDFEGVEKVRNAFLKFEEDHVMSTLINAVTPHLPRSLMDGDNPIRLLYEQLSSGIHTLSEDKCMENAILIDIVFKYVVKKVNEEKYQTNTVKDAMLKLRKNN